MKDGKYFHFSGAGTYQVKEGSGELWKVICPKAGSGTITITDKTSTQVAGAGIITDITLANDTESYGYDCHFLNGLKVVVTGTIEGTIIYQ
jgi:hypothetical protein